MTSATAAILAGAFALGAIPFSYLLGRLRGIDLRQRGSGNIGATNLARSAGWVIGGAGLLLDAGKGALAVLLSRQLVGGADGVPVQAAAGLLAILGHNFTPLLRGRGGKGVATGAGAFLALAPAAFGAALAVFVLAVLLWRMVSLGSILASLTLPLAAWLSGADRSVVVAALLSGALIIVRHRANIGRLVHGTESRIGRRA